MTQIVVFIDGTDNKGKSGAVDNTNVYKMYVIAKARAKTDSTLLVEYIPGVGTSHQSTRNPLRWLQRKLDLAFGGGASERIKAAYLYLAKHYQQNDEVFLVGFSRGAFIARVLAGFIHKVGRLLAGKAYQRYVEYAFYLYLIDVKGHRFHTFLKKMQDRVMPAGELQQIPTHFLGQWDTVAAIEHIGIALPQEEALSRITHREQHHPLPEWIMHCRHALSIHELRPTFAPLLWSRPTNENIQTLRQVWFAGAHADIGGGHAPAPSPLPADSYPPRDGTGTMFSDICLTWMMEEAQTCGLRLCIPAATQTYISGSWPQQNSRGKLPLQSFKVRQQLRDAEQRDLRFEYLHDTACERMWEPPLQRPTIDSYEDDCLVAAWSEADHAAMRLHYSHCFATRLPVPTLSHMQLQADFDAFCRGLSSHHNPTPTATEAVIRLVVAFGNDTAWRQLPAYLEIYDKDELEAAHKTLHQELDRADIDESLRNRRQKNLLNFHLNVTLDELPPDPAIRKAPKFKL